ncbi:MAG: hypothetical protein GXP29_06075 [Planctomycetes bacterium]|nr:hypothetical protein [Planctomycetota bacterium]
MKTKSTLIVGAVSFLIMAVPAMGAEQDANRAKAPESVAAADHSSASEAVGNHRTPSPPMRPKVITTEQLAALEILADNPEFSVSPNTRAAFSPKAAKKIDDLSGPGFYAGFGSTLLILLIAAAPL